MMATTTTTMGLTWEARHENGTVFTLHANKGSCPNIDAATDFNRLIVVGGSVAGRWLKASDDADLWIERIRRSLGPGSGAPAFRVFDKSASLEVIDAVRKEGG